MNYKEETYPTVLKDLLETANSIATVITQKLNESDCPKLNELYLMKSGKIYRNFKLFNSLGYQPSPDKRNLEEGKTNNEFKGLYIFGEKENSSVSPVYVGISRTVYRRLRQHGFGKLHNQCSLAYLMAREENEELTRTNCDNRILEPKKMVIKNYKVALHPAVNDYELYFYEVALAGIFKTKWNSFRTH